MRILSFHHTLKSKQTDQIGAKKIGMRTAFAAYGDTFGTKVSGADWDIKDISELTSIIKRTNNIV